MTSPSIKPIFYLFAGTCLFRFLEVQLFPLTQDEAYYFYWSKFLDFGYFDHPPVIAWLSSFGSLLPEKVWASRIGGAILSVSMFPVMLSLAKISGIKEKNSLFLCLILSQLNLGGILTGIIQTPDLPLAIFWLLAMHEASVALKFDERRWVSAGIMTGLGLMSKYTMALIGFVFLYSLIRKRRGLLSPWPYLGGIACLITFLPHIMWNYHNDWVTFKFQFGRGFKSEYHVNAELGNTLPLAQEAQLGSKEERLAKTFIRPEKKKEKRVKGKFEKYIQGFTNFAGGQLGLWGFLLIPIGSTLWQKRKELGPGNVLDPKLSPLILSSIFIPLILFGLLSPFQKIEANWPAVYLLGGAIYIGAIANKPKPFLLAGIGNGILIALLTLHAYHPLSSGNSAKDRILYETRGFRNLTEYLSQKSEPIFADTYQNTSMLSFYDSDMPVTQWPGITRPSEMIRRQEMMKTNFKQLLNKKAFYLLTNNRIPPKIENFQIYSLVEIRDCLNGNLQIFDSSDENYLEKSCPKAVHRWSLARYTLSDSSGRAM